MGVTFNGQRIRASGDVIPIRIKKSAGSAREESKKAKATPAVTHEAYGSIASIVNRAYQEPGRRLAYFLLNRGVA